MHMSTHTAPRLLALLSCLAVAGCSPGASAPANPAAPVQPTAEPGDLAISDKAGAHASDGSLTCGPQSPRDISSAAGTNPVAVPDGDTPTLCNVHFHEPFEHSGFADLPQTTGATGQQVCKAVDIGDQIEFHWVYTNCAANSPPVKGLGNCVCDREDLVLRVYAQAYVVGDAGDAPTQPRAGLLRYRGSTTGPSYDNETCSPARVNWHVNRDVRTVGVQELATWCASNPWIDEDHPHAARRTVTDPAWLSPI